MLTIDIDADIENLRLHPNANVGHDSAEEMIGSYGYRVSGEDRDWTIQTVDTAWLRERKTEQEIVSLLLSRTACGKDVAEELACSARRIWYDMVQIERCLARAASAYLLDDLAGVLEALREARSLETEHGDDPSTSGLACQLLEYVEETEEEETEA